MSFKEPENLISRRRHRRRVERRKRVGKKIQTLNPLFDAAQKFPIHPTVSQSFSQSVSMSEREKRALLMASIGVWVNVERASKQAYHRKRKRAREKDYVNGISDVISLPLDVVSKYSHCF
jgi:hypothetical protein